MLSAKEDMSPRYCDKQGLGVRIHGDKSDAKCHMPDRLLNSACDLLQVNASATKLDVK